MSIDDEILLSRFRKAIRVHGDENILDLDASLDHKFDFQVFKFEDVLVGTNRMIPPNRWSYHRIGLIKKGSGEFITGIYNYRAPENTLIVVPARLISSSKNWTLDMEGYITVFNTNFFLQNHFLLQHLENKNILTGTIPPYIHLSDKQTTEITDLFETLIKEKQDNKPDKNELIILKLIELLIKTERFFDEQLHFEVTVPAIDILKSFSQLLEIHFIEERTVGFYAEKLNVHPNYLNSLVKKHTGKTAKESIQNRMILEIKYLLHSTNLSIKEISSQLGFNDPNYFTSFFTRYESMSPKNYRSAFV
ncbi:MAG: helix-turn-helix domain-containing protein [Flavisolibacter sp.]